MPSPLAHIAAGYIVYRLTQRSAAKLISDQRLRPAPLLLVTIGLSLAPDLDSIVGVLAGDFGRFHNNLTHSLIVGLAVALVVSAIMSRKQHSTFSSWLIIALLSYDLHVVMDFFTVGRGVMALWPLSSNRYQSPVKLFYGLHWSEGWFSVKHIITLVTEMGLMALAALGAFAIGLRKRRCTDRDQIVP